MLPVWCFREKFVALQLSTFATQSANVRRFGIGFDELGEVHIGPIQIWSATAAYSLPGSARVSSISSVAIFPTMTAAPITSAGIIAAFPANRSAPEDRG
jgi:hypothetical protein